MLEMADDLARLRRELKSLRERSSAGQSSGPDESAAQDERPPHY